MSIISPDSAVPNRFYQFLHSPGAWVEGSIWTLLAASQFGQICNELPEKVTDCWWRCRESSEQSKNLFFKSYSFGATAGNWFLWADKIALIPLGRAKALVQVLAYSFRGGLSAAYCYEEGSALGSKNGDSRLSKKQLHCAQLLSLLKIAANASFLAWSILSIPSIFCEMPVIEMVLSPLILAGMVAFVSEILLRELFKKKKLIS